ncbi:MAG: hypothetical protein HOV83_27885, partial [Catenulispora sp.]|nr:hypothetical protein [Catenulispora sp.]
AAILTVLWLADRIDFLALVLFLAFLAWTFSFLRRLVVVETLVTRLRADAFTGAHPRAAALNDDLVDWISQQQIVEGVIYYGGYKPFIGAGVDVKEWSNAQVLVPARPDPLSAVIGRRNGDGAAADRAPAAAPGAAANGHEPSRIIPFTIEELTAFVEQRLLAGLRDQAPEDRKIEGLMIERPHYREAVGFVGLPYDRETITRVHWPEGYDAAREYLCVRVGSWNEELVTSMFVGFDLKGETLYTEFHTHVLAPIKAGYHLVDRLPAQLGAAVVARAAWDAWKAVVVGVLAPFGQLGHAMTRASQQPRPDETRSATGIDLNLSAYTLPVLGHGQEFSLRELAASPVYHSFFQKRDAEKYMKVVERCLLEAIEAFLRDHNVDLADHAVFQNTILGDVIAHHGTGHISSRNSGTQTQGDSSPVSSAAGKEGGS